MGIGGSKPATAAEGPRGLTVLSKLLEENSEYAAGRTKNHRNVSETRRHLASEGQAPVAAVIACADSRVSPEILFRATLGELFVIRTAGNTPWGPEVVGSLEYAVDHLKVPLVLVLGHTKCGAIGAACAGGDPLPGALGVLITTISKALATPNGMPEDVDAAVTRNVRVGVGALCKDPAACIPSAEKRGDVVIKGAVYDIATGKVNVLNECGTVEVTPCEERKCEYKIEVST